MTQVAPSALLRIGVVEKNWARFEGSHSFSRLLVYELEDLDVRSSYPITRLFLTGSSESDPGGITLFIRLREYAVPSFFLFTLMGLEKNVRAHDKSS